MNTDNIGNDIRHYRQIWDLTQEQVAVHLGVDPRSIRRWETGRVNPRTKNLHKLASILRVKEDSMDRRDFFRKALDMGVMFAVSYQQEELSRLTELLSPATISLSTKEELSIVETLTKACWQLLPLQAHVVDRSHLSYVRDHRQRIEAWLKTSPGSPIDRHLAEAISEIGIIEAEILYALKYTNEAEKLYHAAIRFAHEAGNSPLEVVALTWFSNFLIDAGRASKASAPAEVARRKAEKCGATPLVCAWIAATEADAWANQHETAYKCETALDRAAKFTSSIGIEQERYLVPYDRTWLFGYKGTVYAHLGRPQDGRMAQRELEQGLVSLNSANIMRRWGFYKDLVIAHSLDRHVEEACHYAHRAMKLAEQAKASMLLQRTQDTSQQFLMQWKDNSTVKKLMDEFWLAQQKLTTG